MLICDYYVLTKKRSNFFYLAVGEDVFTFTLSRKYVWNFLFNNRNEDYLKQMVAFCKLKYTQTIYKKVSADRKEHVTKVMRSKGLCSGKAQNGGKGNDNEEGSPAKGARAVNGKSMEIPHDSNGMSPEKMHSGRNTAHNNTVGTITTTQPDMIINDN
jgi:hypothetical protein